jgi:hypothetical protein
MDMRRIVAILAVVVAVVGLMVAGASSASAYGSDHVYQLTFSLNCNNKSSELCTPQVFGLGGFWGWIELDGASTAATSGDYDATLTGCNHLTGTQAGAVHTNVEEGAWATMSSAQLPAGVFPVGTDPNDRYLVPFGTGLAFPSTPGHYSMKFGPGIIAESQVVLMH